MESWIGIDTSAAILKELYCVDTYTRLYGNRWLKFLEALADKYGVEPDIGSRLSVEVHVGGTVHDQLYGRSRTTR